jgi:hypothetical protein
MKTDRELLELAAKAAGVALQYADDEGRLPYDLNTSVDWNPLIDDSDAFRLAVKLELRLDLRHSSNEVSAFGLSRIDEGASNPYAATRRAITRAAAELGSQS